jgi:CubicO group peptidase (beta-lactamase class C family)
MIQALDRRSFILGAGGLAMTSQTLAGGQPPDWISIAPDEAGFASDLGEKLDAGIRSGLLRGLHSVVVLRSGKLVLERYLEGKDESWGRPLGHIRFEADTLHDLRSVTKSVVGLLYGIALDRGLVPPPDASLLAQFPEYADLAADPQRASLKIEHALTMTLGLEWNEQIPYTDPANSEIMMERAKDRNRFVLDRPIAFPPGTRWTYSGGCTALLGHIIAKGAGKPLDAFARESLFQPLGITRLEWNRGADGTPSAASGLRLTPRDAARIGQLVLGQGLSGDQRIVSEEWLAASFRPTVATGDGLEYGRLWFTGAFQTAAAKEPQRWVGGFGNGGQRLWIMPSAGLCAVIMAGNYNAPDGWVTPSRIWREIVLANLLKK